MYLLAAIRWFPDVSTLTLPVRILLAVSITAVGAVLAGLLVQIASKTMMRVKVPRPAVNLVRFAGAGAAGLAAFLWLFGNGGGFGFGGGGGGGPGKEGGGNKGNTLYSEIHEEKKSDHDTPKKIGPDQPAGEVIVRIEILGNKTVRKLADENAIVEGRRYRIPADSPTKLLTLDEVVEFIVQQGRKSRVPDQLFVISYTTETRPQDKNAALERLQELARDLKKDDKINGSWIKTDDTGKPPPS